MRIGFQKFCKVFHNFSEGLKFFKLKNKTKKNFCNSYHSDKSINKKLNILQLSGLAATLPSSLNYTVNTEYF